jgi:aspartyl-tRNA(Asn)/glutamyl-tRNA(Gln) amidotransferase subunit C
MKIELETIDKLAHLSRLSFDDIEKVVLQKDLENIVTFIDKLNRIDTTGVKPMIYITNEKNVLRPDVAHNDLSKIEALSNVPIKDSDYIKVAKSVKKA